MDMYGEPIDDPYMAIAKGGGAPTPRPGDDPYMAIAKGGSGATPPRPTPPVDGFDTNVPEGLQALRDQLAQDTSSKGQDMGHGFKEKEVVFMGNVTRAREDGAVWHKGQWVDPGTLKPAGAVPARLPAAWEEQNSFQTGPKRGPQVVNPFGDQSYVRSSDLKKGGYRPPREENDYSVLRKYGFRDDEIARITQAPSYRPGNFLDMEDAFGLGTRGGEEQSTPLGRVSQGLTNVAMKGVQLGARIPGATLGTRLGKRMAGGGPSNSDYEPEYADAIARIKAAQISANRNPDDMSILGMDPLEVAGQALIPLPGAGAAKGAGALKFIARAAARGAGTAAMQPQSDVRYDESGNSNFGSQLAGQTAVGALVGPPAEAVGAGIGRLFSKRTKAPAPKDVNLLEGDIRSSMLKSAESDAAFLDSVAQAGGDRAEEARRLAESIRAAGDDAPLLLSLSAKTKRLQEKIANDSAYSQVGAAVKGMGDSPVPNTVAALEDVIGELKKNNYPGLEPAIAELRALKDNLLPKTKKVETGILDEMGNPIMQDVTKKPDLSYEALSNTRKTLKAKLRAIYDSNPTGGEGAKGINSDQYQRIAKALEDDLDASIRAQKPGAVPLLERAQSQYRAYKEKWGEDSLNRQLTESKTPDELLKKFVGGSAGSDRAGNVKAAFTQTGVESTKYQILQGAIKESGGNPSAFTKAISDAEKATGVFFEKDDLARLEGLKKIMLYASRSGKVATSGAGAALGSMVGPGTAVAGALVAPRVGLFGHIPADEVGKVASKLMLTPGGQKLLLAASKSQSRGPAWDRLVAQIEEYLTRTSGAAAGEAVGGGSPLSQPKPETQRTY